MAEDKEPDDTDFDLDDGFPDDFDATKRQISATTAAKKQHGDLPYEIDSSHLATWDRKAKATDMIKCTGQLLMWYGKYEDEAQKEISLTGGTATVIKALPNNHFVAVTCGHNFVDYDPIDKKRTEPKRTWFFPKGSCYGKCRLNCMKTAVYDEYDPTKPMCPNDVAVVLLCDKKGEASKHFEGVNMNETIVLDNFDDDEGSFSLWGYPTKSGGKLQGQNQRVAIALDGLWKYERTLYTYPGHSGSVLYETTRENKQYKYHIYGIHIFGDPKEQKNCGVLLDQAKLDWIQGKLSEFEQIAIKHVEFVRDKPKDSDRVDSDNTTVKTSKDTESVKIEKWLKSLSTELLEERNRLTETIGLDDRTVFILFEKGYDDKDTMKTLKEEDLKTMKIKKGHIKKLMYHIDDSLQVYKRPKDDNSDEESVDAEEWLKDIVRLKQNVIDVLFNEGYDDMISIQSLKEEDLKELNVKKGHIKQIMYYIADASKVNKEAKDAESVNAKEWLANAGLKENDISVLFDEGYDNTIALQSLEEEDLNELGLGGGFIVKLLKHLTKPQIAVKQVETETAVITIIPTKKPTEYKLEYREEQCDDADWTSVSEKATKESRKEYKIKGLKPDTAYTTRASTNHQFGWSVSSKSAVFRTKKKLPSPPKVEVKDVRFGSAVFAIKENKSISIRNISFHSSKEKIIKYKLEYREEQDDNEQDDGDDEEQDGDKEQDGDEEKSVWTSIIIENEKAANQYIVEGLKPTTVYLARAAVEDKFGWSGFTKTFKFETKKLPFIFKERNGYNEILNHGATMKNVPHDANWQVTAFGEYMDGKTVSKCSFKFRLDDDTNNDNVAIGLITPEFNEFNDHTTPNTFYHKGSDGKVFYDENCFKCNQPHTTQNKKPFFMKIGDKIKIEMDITKGIGKLNGMEIKLPKSVCIAFFSCHAHKISLVKQNVKFV